MAMNRTTWKPGQSGNPKGRPPKARCLTDCLRDVLAETVEVRGQRLTKAQVIASILLGKAIRGSMDAIRLIFDRTEGRPPLMESLFGDELPMIIRLPVHGPAELTPDEAASEPVGAAMTGQAAPNPGPDTPLVEAPHNAG